MAGMTAAVATVNKPRTKATTRKRTPDEKQRVLDAFRQTLHMGKAAAAAGVGRSCIHNWRQNDPAFAAAWQDIIDNVCDDLEVVGVQRAIEGDTQALKFFLQSWRRDTYANTMRVHHTVEREQRVAVLVATLNCTREEALQAIEMAEKALAAGAVVEGSAEVRE